MEKWKHPTPKVVIGFIFVLLHKEVCRPLKRVPVYDPQRCR